MNVIVAADKNWGIGKNNQLLVSIPADMKMFREETSGKVVVMGRKTLESFPNFAYEADSHFPNLDEDDEWEITGESDEQTYFDLEYQFVKYERKK